MKVIGGFSAPLNGCWSGEMSSRQKQKTPRNSLSETDINTDIENPFHDLDVSISIAAATSELPPRALPAIETDQRPSK